MVVSAWVLSVDGSTAETLVSLPEHLSAHVPDHPTRFVLRTRVAVPPSWRGQALTFAIPHLRALASLSVNGREMTQLDPGFTDRYRGSGHPRFRLPGDVSSAGDLELELFIDHRWTQSAWVDSIPHLSATEQGDAAYLFIRGWNDVTALSALAMALFVLFGYAIIYFLDRRPEHGWFTLEAAAACAYPAFELGLLQPIFSVYDGAFMMASVTLATVAGVHFTYAEFGLGRVPRVIDAGFFVCLAAAAVASGPFALTRYAGPVAAAIIGGNVGFQIATLMRVRRDPTRRKSALLLFASWVALAMTASVDLAAWLGLGEVFGGLRTACLGVTLIALAQSAELSIAHISSLKRADALNAELAARLDLLTEKHREVEVLNEELKFQVASRSEQLAVALSRVGMQQGRARPLEPGEIIEARYRVVRQVGEGAMGAVYEVERVSDKRRLALKMLTDISGGLNVARFAREAQIVSQLSHPNVISVVDLDVSSSGFFYMVMEFVAGLSLRQQQDRFRDPRLVMQVLRQVAEGLAAIHAKGVVHRDLKPGNILVTKGERDGALLVKIADFGISSLESAPDDAPAPAPLPAPLPTPVPVPVTAPAPVLATAPASATASASATSTGSEVPAQPPSPRQSLPEGMPPSLRGILPPPPGEPSTGDRTPTSHDVIPRSLRDIVPPPSSRSLADRLMERLNDHDSWDTGPGPVSANRPPPSLRSGSVSLRPQKPSLLPPEAPLTQTGALMGTPIYMAPELAAGVKFAKPSADIFSLGVIGYELLTGSSPFPEPPALMRLAGRTAPPPEPLRTACPKLPPLAASIIERCLARDPADRPTAREVADALTEAVKLCA
jgi:serine/threonine protein kinase